MNKRDFVKMIGLGAASLAIPQMTIAENQSIGGELEDDFSICGIEFRILLASDKPDEVVFNSGQIMRFIKHPQHLLVICVDECDEIEEKRQSWMMWRPIKSLKILDVLREVGHLCETRFADYEFNTDYDMESGPEQIDEKITDLEDAEITRRYDAYMEKVVTQIDSLLKV